MRGKPRWILRLAASRRPSRASRAASLPPEPTRRIARDAPTGSANRRRRARRRSSTTPTSSSSAPASRVRGSAAARAGGQAGARPRRARGGGRRERPQRRLRAARHAGAVRRHGSVGRRAARERDDGLDGAGARHDRGARGRRLPPGRLAADRGRRGGARRAPRRVRGPASRPASPPSWVERLRAAARGSFHGCAPPRSRRRAAAGALGAAARGLAAAEGVEIREHDARRVDRRARPAPPSSSAPTAIRAGCSARSRG